MTALKASIDPKVETVVSFRRKMLGIAAGCAGGGVEHVLMTLLKDEEGETLKTLDRCGLKGALWDEVRAAYGYAAANPDPWDFALAAFREAAASVTGEQTNTGLATTIFAFLGELAQTEFQPATADEAVRSYAESWSRLDGYYRTFTAFAHETRKSDETLAALAEIMDGNYVNNCLVRMNTAFQKTPVGGKNLERTVRLGIRTKDGRQLLSAQKDVVFKYDSASSADRIETVQLPLNHQADGLDGEQVQLVMESRVGETSQYVPYRTETYLLKRSIVKDFD